LWFALNLGVLENFVVFQIAKNYYWKCKTLRASSSIGLNLEQVNDPELEKLN
jgi:hypothetical protein